MLALRYDWSDDFFSNLFVGIDVSSKSNTICALDYKGNKLINLNAPNNYLRLLDWLKQLTDILGIICSKLLVALLDTSLNAKSTIEVSLKNKSPILTKEHSCLHLVS